MTLAGVVESLDEVPEALREHYEAGTDGKFRLAIQGMVDKSKVDEFRNNNIDLRRKLESFEGLDLAEIEKLKEKVAEAERIKAESTGDWAAREAQLRTELSALAAKEREKLEARNKAIETALDHEVRVSKATAAIAEHKGSTKVLLDHVLKHTKMVEEDGRFGAIVVDEKGNPRFGDSQGNNMSISQLVESMKQDPDFARNFEGSGSSGGGSSKSSAGGGHTKSIAADDEAGFMANLEAIASGEMSVTP